MNFILAAVVLIALMLCASLQFAVSEYNSLEVIALSKDHPVEYK